MHAGVSHAVDDIGSSYARYEVKAVGLLALGFGMVGLDRFIINPLFPAMQKDLGLNYQELGLISAVLALGWGIASIFSGRLSDRLGRKRVLVPAIGAFSLLVATSGLASGLMSLLLIRGLMGLAEGAYVPASIVATIDASKPSRIGLNIGLQQMASPLVGSFLGPLIAIGLLKVLPSWHWVFAVVSLPGLVVACLLARVLRERQPAASVRAQVQAEPPASWRNVLSQRAVLVNTASMCCFLTSLLVVAAFMPNYLVDHLQLDLDRMSIVLSAFGAGGCLGMVLVPALSDRLGCKPVMIGAMVFALAALWILPSIGGAQSAALCVLLFVAAFMNTGVLAINVGPLTHGSVPARCVTTATGVVVGIGEVFGGAVAPAMAGAVAQRFGIAAVPWIAIGAMSLACVIVVLAVREPTRATAGNPADAGMPAA
ncbi:MFS transporter [Paraburkholderia youngii]|uniref:MFS transporter n=1 Tax=Paraburkholderia youngii TaxID=2782701 RepID=UPI003D197F4E